MPRLRELWISGFRSLRDIKLQLDGLTVLIGDNGSGKSSIVEGLELLRCTAHEGYGARVSSGHGGMHQLLEHGADAMSLVATIDDGGPGPLRYAQRWSRGSPAPDELLVRWGDPRGGWSETIAERWSDTAQATIGERPTPITRADSMVFVGAAHHPDMASVAAALAGIDVHLPFQVTASWASHGQDRKTPRGVSLVEPTTRLERFGTNLVNAYQALKNDFGVDHWRETLEYVQLGLDL
ncbi:MAG: AAA family ATPase, partial [Myxococcales bacterium]|nr:AAA family ATPase [Myxococcales bacterium]